LSLGATTTGASNTAVGWGSLYSNTTAGNNSALGNGALFLNTTGTNNTAVGFEALRNNTTASDNTAVGTFSSYTNVTGTRNVSVGKNALNSSTVSDNAAVGFASAQFNTTGNSLASLGSYALHFNTTGNDNTAVGRDALLNNTTASFNTAIGRSALRSNTTTSNNVAVGYQAAYSSQAANNVAVGYHASYSNTTGSGLTSVGYQALTANTTGAENTAIGRNALSSNTTGGYNTALGRQALNSNTTANYNTAVGYEALKTNTTGANNTALGYSAGSTLTTGTNNTLIGYNAQPSSATVSNEVTIGDDNVTVTRLKGNVGIGTSSPHGALSVLGQGRIVTIGSGPTANTPELKARTAADTGYAFFDISTYRTKFFTEGSERMVIREDGNVGIGTTSPTAKLHVTASATGAKVIRAVTYRGVSCENGATSGETTDGAFYSYTGNAASTAFNHYAAQCQGAVVFKVLGNGNVQNTNNSYGAISDVKLKENIVDTTSKLSQLNQVRVVNYNFIGDAQKQIGVIAQELESIFPSMVEEIPERDEEGNDIGTTAKSVKYSVFVPILIKAIQEQQETIKALETRIQTLENN
jgi:hypothetical protein